MNALFSVPLALLMAISLVALAVYTFDDRTILVPPPEAVSESFMRALETGRYECATAYLNNHQKQQHGPEQLKTMMEGLSAHTGEIYDVKGEPLRTEKNSAEASVVLSTQRSGETRLKFGLVWDDQHVWKVSDLTQLQGEK